MRDGRGRTHGEKVGHGLGGEEEERRAVRMGRDLDAGEEEVAQDERWVVSAR